MTPSANLWLYFLVVSGVIILPGMDMAFVMGSSMTGGRRTGLAAVAGIVAGGVCHMAIAATGISAVLKLMPAAFVFMLAVGAAYIAWIGWCLLGASAASGPVLGASSGARTPARSFSGAMATSLLNPKAYVFMLAIFPQFVHAGQGSVWAQAGVLGLITAATQLAVYGGLALVAARARTALAAQPKAAAWVGKAIGAVLIAAAALTLYGGIINM